MERLPYAPVTRCGCGGRSVPAAAVWLSLLWVCFLVVPAAAWVPDPNSKFFGRWSTTKDWQIPGTHLALLRGADTSSVILMLPTIHGAGSGQVEKYYTWRWRSDTTIAPPLDTLNVTPTGLGNMFCSGHSALADGRLFLAGGGTIEGEHLGSNRRTNIFNPISLTWAPQPPDMAQSRFYPTNVTMPDRTVLTFSGSSVPHVVGLGGSATVGDFSNDLQMNVGLDESFFMNPAPASVGGSLTARRLHTCVFEPELEKTKGTYPPEYEYMERAVVFGGYGSTGLKNDVWALVRDELENEWLATELFPAPDPTLPIGVPVARRRHGAAVEVRATGNRMLVYGGTIAGGAAGDCWELGLMAPGATVGAWRRVIDAGGPGRRTGHTVTLLRDDAHEVTRLVVIGGRLGGEGGAFSDTVWVLNLPDGGTPGWNVMRTGGPNREGHVAVDAVPYLDAIVLIGGRDPDGLRNDVWAFRVSDSTWVPVVPGVAGDGSPQARYLHAGVYDNRSGRVVVSGGATLAGGGAPVSDVWSFELKLLASPGTWRRDFASLPSGPRFGHSAFLDPRLSLVVRVPERFSLATNSWQGIGTLERYLPFYPYVFVLPDGRLFHAGPDSVTDFADPQSMAWGDTLFSHEQAGSAALYRPDKALKCGGLSLYKFPGTQTTEWIDLSAPSPAWIEASGMTDPRTEHNLTILPNGTVLMTGGLETHSPQQPVQYAQIWDGTSWSVPLASENEIRDYHSAAILLPDGRVLSSGGNIGARILNASLYEPAYLFLSDGNYAPRPRIASAPYGANYGQTFVVETDAPATVAKVTLIRPGAVTHSFNQDQRYLELGFTVAGAGQLQVTAPPDSFHAPPGNYLLFLVDQAGVPSTAKWLMLQPPPGGGCPVLDVLTAGGWSEENTLLGRSLDGAPQSDTYRLKSVPAKAGQRYRLRIRENGGDYTTLDEIGLTVVDHVRHLRAAALDGRVLLGTREPARLVTTRDGRDITQLVDGSGTSHFVGEPGETLTVVMPDGDVSTLPDIDPFEIDPGGKGGGGNPFAAGLERLGPAQTDSVTLSSSGMLLQGRSADGNWVTVRRKYPRQRFDECLIDTLDHGTSRLAFVGRHSLRFVGRFNPVAAPLPQRPRLLAAWHSRLGDVLPAVSARDGNATIVGPGDTLYVEFEAGAGAGELERDVFLHVHGSYSAVSPLAQRAAEREPLRFALEQNRPNPFRSGTTIEFVLSEASSVDLWIFDLQGRVVARLAQGAMSAGRQSLEWDGRDGNGRRVPPGVYHYAIHAGRDEARRKLVVLP